MRNISITALMSSIILIGGCSGSSVEIVKSDYIDADKKMSNSQLLDNRKVCDKVMWSDFRDSRDRIVVEYQCELKGGQDYLKKQRDHYVKSTIENRDSTLQRFKSQYEAIASLNNADNPDLTQRLSEKIAEFESKKNNPPKSSPELIKLVWASEKIDSLMKNFSEENVNELIFSPKTPSSLQNQFESISNPLRTSLHYLSKEPKERQIKYKKDQVDPYYAKFKSELSEFKVFIKVKYDAEIAEIDSRHKRDLSSLQETIQSIKEDGAKSRESNDQMLIDLDAKIKSFDISGFDKEVNDKAFIKYPVYTKVVERFQWIVNKEKKPFLEFGGMTAYIENAEPIEMLKYHKPHLIFQAIAQSDPDSLHAYTRQLDNFSIKQLILN